MTDLINADKATADHRTESTSEARSDAKRMLWPMLFPYRTAAPSRPAAPAKFTADGENRRVQDAQLRTKSP